MNHHARTVITEAPAEQCTEAARACRRDHLRDAIGSYPAHGRLEIRPVGLRILEEATDMHLAFVDAIEGLSSTEVSEASGFRSPTDVRKLRSAALMVTNTDLAVLKTLYPDRHRDLLATLCIAAGGRFELLNGTPGELNVSIARLDMAASKLASNLLLAKASTSDGGIATTAGELRAMREILHQVKALVADVESILAERKE